MITTKSTWRWIYLYNVPCAVVGTTCLLVFWPRKNKASEISFRSLQKVDFFGAVLLLAASTLVVFALQEAGTTRYAWNSAMIVSTLVLSSVCWLAFFAWIAWLDLGKRALRMRAVLPLRVAFSRPTGPALMLVSPPTGRFIADRTSTVFLTGFPWFITIINLPQRFQIVNGNTPIKAGLQLLPLLCSMALGKF